MAKAQTQKEIQKKHVLSTNFKKHQFRTAYQPRVRVQIKTQDSRTEQSHADECDINKILSSYIKTGTFNANLMDKHQKLYGDFSGHDFEEAQNLIARAQSLFEELPSIVRNRFHNSPAQFLDFAGDEKNMTEMVEMGLANAPQREETSEPVEVITETKADESPRDNTVDT
jgi:hypothetical protein